MYIILVILLSICSILELNLNLNNETKGFKAYFLLLTIILAIRYGQGTDYYNYLIQFSRVDMNASLLVNELYHGEIGWYILLILSKRIGMSFDIFICFISVIMMCSIQRGIKKHSPYKITSLLLFYPTFYLTYCFSALRQGLIMTIFIGFGLDYLLEKKYFKYYCLIAVLILFHKSSFVLLFLPIALHFKDYKIEKYLIFAVILGIVFGYTGILNRVASLIGITSYLEVSVSIMAILLRSILFFVIYKLHKINVQSRIKLSHEDLKEDILYYIYMIGYSIFLCLAFAGTLSQRLTMPIKAIEIILLPILLYNVKKLKGTNKFTIIKIGKLRMLFLMLLIICMVNVETIKNIDSYIEQGNYYAWVNPVNYPYSNIFNKKYIMNYIPYFNGQIDEH